MTKKAVLSEMKLFSSRTELKESGKTVILALYDGNKFVEVQSAAYEGEKLVFNTAVSYTTAKVMVWDALENPNPFCKAETVE